MSTRARTAIAAAVILTSLLAGCDRPAAEGNLDSARKHLARHEHVAAVIELKAALQKAETGEARYLLGTALLEQGDAAAALLEFAKAQQLQFDPDQLAPRLAHAMVLAGKAKEVIDQFVGNELHAPAHTAELYTALALAHSRLGHRAEADAALAKALASDPKYPWALLTQARKLVGQGKVDEALATAEQARLPGGPNGEVDLFQGQLLAAANRPPEAVVKALTAAAEDPLQTLRARTLLAEHYLRHNNLPAAKEQLAMLQKLAPQNLQTVYLDAALAFEEGAYARSESVVDTLLRVVPNNAQALVLGGAASLRRGSLIAAETKLGRAVQTTENAVVARRLLAETYLRMAQPAKAMHVLKPLIERPRPDVDALVLAAQGSLMSGDINRAESLFAAVASSRPDDMTVKTALALITLDRGNSNEAFNALRSISQRDTGDSADLATISRRLRRQEFDEALTAIAALEKKQPTAPTAAYLRGLALAGKGDVAGARQSFEAALKIAPTYQAALLELTRLDVEEQKLDAARSRLAKWVEAHPTDVAMRMALLDVRLRQNAPGEELLSAIDEAIRIAPTEPAPYLAKIVQTKRIKGTRDAVAAAQTALAALPNHVSVLDAAGVVFSAAGEDQQAISVFNRMASQAPASAVPFLRLSDVHSKLGNVAAATSALERAFDLDPVSPDVHRQLLAYAAKYKDFKMPLSAAKRLQQRYGDRPAGFELEGDLAAAQRRWDAAATAYRAGLARGAGTRLAIKTWDVLALGGSGHAGAEAFAREWIAKHPTDSAFHAFLADRARGAKDYAAAERNYRRVLELRPEHGIAMNNLAWVLGQSGRRAEGIEWAQKATRLYPKAAPYMDTLASLLAADGQAAAAIDWQRRAVGADDGDVSLKLGLAKLLLDAGQKQEARSLLATLAKSNASAPASAEVQRLLKLAS
ncbi:MAG: PEP-CTERM system TPR-repeat protein PrsT [Proteobacteria bacterium]|nr:PEP-CTERM system TPR-repeat protein PrsT [Pseudomonadota bacterium]